ncbi:uncharacterized protein [Dermacentor albipictus]|uniref:uncharacterized protein n=1 Tax=Dermacentor albipictus TaxID=60249 RepID=UPI0038FCDB78
MNTPQHRTRIAVAVTSCCLGWNCLCLLMRSQPWSQETFGIAKKSESVAVNAIIDFVYATNAASDILLILVIYYQTRQPNMGAMADSKLVRRVLKLFIIWNGFAIFLLWSTSCVTSVRSTLQQVRSYARKDHTNETPEANVTSGALIGLQAEGHVPFWTPLAVLTTVAFIRVFVLVYCFVGYLGLLSDAASDSVFDAPMDAIFSSTASLSSVRPSSSTLAPREYRTSTRNLSYASTSPMAQTKTSDTQHVETSTTHHRKPKQAVVVTPTMSSLSDGIALRVVPGPTFKRPSYVCSVSPPNIQHSTRVDGVPSGEDSPSATAPASFDAIQAATLASIFGTAHWRFGGTRLPSLAVPSPGPSGNSSQTDIAKAQSVEAPRAPVGELNRNASRNSSPTHSENDVAKAAVGEAAETPLPSPAGEAAAAAKPSRESAKKHKQHERRSKGKSIPFGSRWRRGGRHAFESGAAPLKPTATSPARKRRSDKGMVPLDDHPFAVDDSQRRAVDEDGVHGSSPTPGSVTSMEASSEVVGSVTSGSTHVASPLVTFSFRTPPSSAAATPATPEDVAQLSEISNRARGAFIVAPPVVEKREQAVQTDMC